MACRRISDRRAEETAGAPLLAFFENGGLNGEQGAAILEFAISLPLLVVFIVGIYDFSGAFNQKQKVEQAAQEGAIVAGAQPMTDIGSNPASLQAVATAVYNSLVGSGVLPTGTCTPPGAVSGASLTWTYTMSGCPDNLVVTVNRGAVFTATSPAAVGTTVTVAYPYHWRFNSVIQLLFPGGGYAATTPVTETATVHNQM
ncbi:MAG: TadE/TadG family type IV pilus assembly protein [Terriglobales bacterium]|jgi:Flp pilus assembly protein TadG